MGLPRKPGIIGAKKLRITIATGTSARLPHIARAMSSTPIASGSAMNSFVGGCRMANFRQAKRALLI